MLKLIPLHYKVAAIVALISIAGFGFWKIYDGIWQRGFAAGKITQAQISEEQCREAQNITREVSHEYQKQIADLNRQLDALRLRPKKCITIASESSGGYNAAAEESEYDQQNGVPTEALYRFAAESEQYRLQLISCQKFITKIDGG